MNIRSEKIFIQLQSRVLAKSSLFESSVLSYAFAVGAVAVAIVLSKFITPVIKDNSFDIFLGAVLLSTYCGGYAGIGPGLLASVLSIVAIDYFFIPPINAFSFGMTDLLGIAVFGLLAILAGSLSGRLKKEKFDLQQARDTLEVRVNERTEELLRANRQLQEEIARRLEAQTAILEISNREQRRIGQDLHDGLIQVLTGVRLLVWKLKEKLITEKHPLSDDVRTIESCLSDALSQADTISRGLYPVELETQGLMAALEELSDKISRVYPVSCLFICRTPIPIGDSGTATHLYRIAQEAVSNAIKSGKAKRINIRLFERKGRVFLTIADNGIGFQKGQVRNGMGLRIMQYRSGFINGELQFRSRPGGGTRVQCVFHPRRKEEEKLNEA